jgi:hypothetical protein
MGEFSCSIKPASSSARKKTASKTASGSKAKSAAKPKRIRISGTTNDPKKREALVKELKKLATKYKFDVTES